MKKIPCSPSAGMSVVYANWNVITRPRGAPSEEDCLKRFISDTYTYHLNQKEEFNLVKHKENVAVVGGGPGGLMCAYDLSKRGYRVTIFEASDRLGGALWLIPSISFARKSIDLGHR